jgi:hypothetical protein
MVHVVPKGVQLPPRHLYLLERLEEKVAAVNSRIAAWQQWLAAALPAAAAGEATDSNGNGSGSIEWAPVGAPAQVGEMQQHCCGQSRNRSCGLMHPLMHCPGSMCMSSDSEP